MLLGFMLMQIEVKTVDVTSKFCVKIWFQAPLT